MIGEKGRWKWENGKFVPYEKKTVETHFVAKDEIPAVESPITGKVYTSLSKLEQEYKEHGYQIASPEDKRKDAVRARQEYKANFNRERLEDIRKAMNLIKYNEAPLTEKEKEQCKREQRELEAYKRRMKA